MSTINDYYDPNEELYAPSPEMMYQILGSPNIFDLNNADTPAGMIPSNGSSLNSLPRSTTLSDVFPFNDFEFTSSLNNLGTTLPKDEFETNLTNSDTGSMFADSDIIYQTFLEQDDEKLRIIAEPKAFYRERYATEIDPKKHRAQRFIRAKEENGKYEYPTVKIPAKFCDPKRQLFIQVTLVTILSKNAPVTCIHPYAIDTQENNVIKDQETNSLYFRVNEDEFVNGEKSFRISRKKMTQHDLLSYGPWRLFDSNQNDIQRVRNVCNAKQIIATYQLWKSQLVFTIAERSHSNFIPISFPNTSVKSQIMIDEASDGRNASVNNSDGTKLCNIKCIPQKGDWQGGEEVVLILPNRTKRKVYNIYFDFGSFGRKPVLKMNHIDTKTIVFQTPPCPVLPSDANITVSVIITYNDTFNTQIDFHYLTPIKTNDICSNCQLIMINYNMGGKRRHGLLYNCETDGGENLILEMNNLSIEQKTNGHRPRSASSEDSKFDKYLNQLKEALAEFVRTTNPSRLFRRTRLLLSKCDDKSPPLNDAIQRGHTELALSLIEQVVTMASPDGLLEQGNENGETPLLIAAKMNQGKLIETILEKRSDLAQQKDKNDNNFLHLLANLAEDKGAEVLKNILEILPIDVKTKLVEEKNKTNETPMEIAQSHVNTQCVDLLNLLIDA